MKEGAHTMTAEVFTKLINWIATFVAKVKAMFDALIEDITGMLKK